MLFSGLKLDAELLHGYAIRTLSYLGRLGTESSWQTQWMQQQFCFTSPRLSQSCWGLTFPNPVGLAAGFDKDGEAALVWPWLGFGLAELGTVTRHGQPGNPAPRLFRLVDDGAVLNRMGFNNQGATALAGRLEQYWRDRPARIPMGINLGKSKVTPLAEAAADYQASFQLLQPYGDYFVINVSSPNTPGLRSLQSVEHLGEILTALRAVNNSDKPLLVKIAPDLAWADIDAIVDLAITGGLAGIIATNTTIARQGLKTQRLAQTGNLVAAEAGGISGLPLQQRSTEIIRHIYSRTQGTLPIIGVGGIFTAADAWEKITAGASLVQTYTGWLYEGPWMVRRLLTGLLTYLDQADLAGIGDAVGLSHRR